MSESPIPKVKRGRKPQTHCMRGHDMSITRRRGKRSTYCHECTKAGDFPSWRPSRRSDYELQRRYGISLEQKRSMLAAQGGCAICGTNDFGPKGSVVDHCHTTSTVRGILCTPCNTAIGLFRENPDVLRAAVRYLEANSATPS
jgi:hypothetical protein